MKFSDSSTGQPEADPSLAGPDAVLAREAGMPFQPPLAKDSGIAPFVEWLGLMENGSSRRESFSHADCACRLQKFN